MTVLVVVCAGHPSDETGADITYFDDKRRHAELHSTPFLTFVPPLAKTWRQRD